MYNCNMYLYKFTIGLFNAVIMSSGSSLSLWALNRKARRTAFATGKDLGIDTLDSMDLVEKLRQINYTSLQESALEVSFSVSIKKFNNSYT